MSTTPDTTRSHLAVEDLEQGYGSTTVVRGFTHRFTAGVTALLGPNGAGKTTLLTTLATVLPPRSGRLEVAGEVVASERDARRARHHIGYLPQHFGDEPGMRVADAVAYGAWVRGVPSRQWDAAVADVLEHVGLTDRARSRMRSLSGGMRQRAAIAWALVGRPAVVLLDEPTVGLDPEQRLHFRRCLSGLTGTAVVLSTHLISDVDAVCDRAVVMAGGRALFSGDVADLRRLDPGDGEGHTDLERAYSALVRAAAAGSGTVAHDGGVR